MPGYFSAIACLFFFIGALPNSGLAQTQAAEKVGVSTGLPVPRFVSLKSGTVNMRQGPGKDHRTLWVFKKAGLPVEVVAEFDTWRKVRDWEGAEGWVFHTLLSGRRTGMVTPWQKKGLQTLYKKPDENAAMAAKLEPRVLAKIRSCSKNWCRISGEGFDGYIVQKLLWGVYPNEKLE